MFVHVVVGRGKDETIRLAVAEVARNPVELLTLHGGAQTMRAAVAGRGEQPRLRLLSVTLLSSLGRTDLEEVGLVGPTARFSDLDGYVAWRADLAENCGCDGMIASGTTVAMLRRRHPQALLVVPGVRPGGRATDEHKRSITPGDAIRAGADHLVVGRPIRDASPRRDAARRILDEIETALG